jgi:hypothetical protein
LDQWASPEKMVSLVSVLCQFVCCKQSALMDISIGRPGKDCFDGPKGDKGIAGPPGLNGSPGLDGK